MRIPGFGFRGGGWVFHCKNRFDVTSNLDPRIRQRKITLCALNTAKIQGKRRTHISSANH